jgi:hypothetical protein
MGERKKARVVLQSHCQTQVKVSENENTNDFVANDRPGGQGIQRFVWNP